MSEKLHYLILVHTVIWWHLLLLNMVRSSARSDLLQALQATSEEVTQLMFIWPGQSVQKSGNVYTDYPSPGFLPQRKEKVVCEQLCLQRFLLFPWNGTRIRACPISQASAQFILLLLCIFVNLHLLFAFFFSSYKWNLALSTKNLEVNVLRQEDLSFVSMKLLQKFHLRDVFSPVNFTIPANLGLIYLGYFQKKRTFIPVLFLASSLADQQRLCNKDTQPQSSIGWSRIFCGTVNRLSCTMRAVVFHHLGCQVWMQFSFKVAISKRTFGKNWLCLKADACCPVIATSLKYFSSNSCMPLSSLDACHGESQM